MKPKNTALALALTKAIAYNENGGAPDLNNLQAGKSGEMKSIFQYTPATWKGVSEKYLGGDKPLNSDNETIATTARVSDWLDKGMTPEQILSMQNAGAGEPDAYTGKFSDGSPSTGTNKYGVKYNVEGYVKNGMKYLAQFEPEMAQKISPNTGLAQSGNSTAQVAPHVNPTQTGTGDPLSNIMAALSSATPASQTASAQGPKGPQVAGVLSGPKPI